MGTCAMRTSERVTQSKTEAYEDHGIPINVLRLFGITS